VSTLTWIILAGVAMSLLALIGAVTLVLPERLFQKLVPPLVALAAGSLTGGALLHLLPVAVTTMGNTLAVYELVIVGFLAFFMLEQFLHWHHCHRPVSQHGHLGYLILLADGVHNFLGGLAVGSAFLADVRLGVVTWTAAALHEVPQELGDFGILVHAGWSKTRALAFNLASAATFLLGGLAVYLLSADVDVAWLVPLAAGNFLYIAAVDLTPGLTVEPEARHKVLLTAMFVLGVAILWVLAVMG
jgi:zinc and cadmium transporter